MRYGTSPTAHDAVKDEAEASGAEGEEQLDSDDLNEEDWEAFLDAELDAEPAPSTISTVKASTAAEGEQPTVPRV